jgi:protocatechuate 3,4-dioxygenase beta subunit
MHRAAIVPLVALVLVIGSFPFTTPASAQSSASLEGLVCSTDHDYRYPGGPDDKNYCMGSGLPGATVTLSQPGLIMGVGGTEHAGTTDDRGWFRITGVADGEYQLRIERTGFSTHTETFQMQGAKHIEVSLAGQNVSITGHVRDHNGTAIQGAIASLSGPGHHQLESDSQGRIQATVKAGHYSIQVSHPDHRTLWHHQLLDGQEELVLVLQKAPERTVTITGTVRDQDGQAVSGATVEAWQYHQYGYDYGYDYAEDSSASSTTDPAEPRASMPYPYYDDGYQTTTTDSQGRFTLKVHAGWVNLNIWKEGHARYSQGFEVADGETRTVDAELPRFPDKTAHITGRVTGPDGAGLQWVSISVESPQYGLYECSVRGAGGNSSGGGTSSSAGSADGAEPAPDMAIWPGRDYYSGCAITVHADGTFEGNVTPGYSIVRVYYEHWQSCTETRHADGSYTRTCGPDYFQHAQVIDLPADTTTRLDVQLKQRPGPDATLSGYVVDTETGQALSGVTVYLSNQDNYGWAHASTDADGSFKVRLRSGVHSVSVYADGYFRWEGTIEVPAGRETPLDIHLTAGQDQYGWGCCYPMPYLRGEEADGAASGPMPPASPTAPGSTSETDSATASESYQDLGGGLGPYDADQRAKLLAEGGSQGIPGPGLILVGTLLAGLVLAVRRRQ